VRSILALPIVVVLIASSTADEHQVDTERLAAAIRFNLLFRTHGDLLEEAATLEKSFDAMAALNVRLIHAARAADDEIGTLHDHIRVFSPDPKPAVERMLSEDVARLRQHNELAAECVHDLNEMAIRLMKSQARSTRDIITLRHKLTQLKKRDATR
jgi:hypothetical protein